MVNTVSETTNLQSSILNFQLICGLEIHAELKTKSKMFCSCANNPFHADKPNIYTCPVCLGLPGALPVANKKAIEWTIKLGLALGCEINLFSKFDRKHYFYPDLPKGYQISQYDIPFCFNGQIETSDGIVRIRRIHLEEDTAKLLHKTIDGKKVSLIDFNRSSVPLVEIVSEPDIRSASQAKEYAKKIRDIIRYLDIGDCDMEQGGMRLEANISLMPVISTERSDWRNLSNEDLPNYKVEVKNINSFRFLEQAINHEIKLQSEQLEKGETPLQQTKGYNASTGETFIQRSKEDAEDYRYFPDPDIPPIRFSSEQIEEIRKSIPILADKVIEEWQSEHGVEERFGELLISDQNSALYFTKVFELCSNERLDANKLASMVANGKLKTTDDPEDLVESFKSTNSKTDMGEIELKQIIDEVIGDNQAEYERYKNGEKQLLNFFIGQVMRKSKGSADASKVVIILNS